MHSFLRALEKEKVLRDAEVKLPYEYENEKYFSEAGIHIKSKDNVYSVVSLKKGGTLKVFIDGCEKYLDCGYRVNYGKGKVGATNWQDSSYTIKQEDNELLVSGRFNLISTKTPTPFLNFGLRVAAKIFGNRMISFLKKMIILVDKHNDISFERRIVFEKSKIIINDNINSPTSIDLESASNFSLRHVASGKFFSLSDLSFRDRTGYKQIKHVNIEKVYDCLNNKLTVKKINIS